MKSLIAPDRDVAELYDDIAKSRAAVAPLVRDQRQDIDARFAEYDNIVANPLANPSRWTLGLDAVSYKAWIGLYERPPKCAISYRDRFDPEFFEECSYCGGINEPDSVDHYLEKKLFPEFSLFGVNLVPACRGCNPSQSAIDVAGVAKISPYLSDVMDRVQLHCVFSGIGPGGPQLSLSVDPARLSVLEATLCDRHMQYFKLHRRFARFAGQEWRRTSSAVCGYTNERVAVYLDEQKRSVKDYHQNHWRRVFHVDMRNDGNAMAALALA